jgi:transcription termination factor Rho
VQEEETNIVDQAVEPTVDATPDTEHQETADSEDKPTRTLKLNRSGASTAEETSSADGDDSATSSDGDNAQAAEEGENQGGGRNRRNRNRRNRREPHVPS